MNPAFIGLFGAGFLLGLKHALDADHIAAISALNPKGGTIMNSSLIGIFWGIGHTASLLAAGLMVLSLKITIPEKLALSLEFAVGVVLAALGFNVLATMKRNKVHFHKHKHGEKDHIHFHSHSIVGNHSHSHQPLLIGLVHGLAGSAALTLLVLSTIDTLFLGMAYITIFGIGSIIGMVLISNIISLPFRLVTSKFEKAASMLTLSAGLTSLIIGFSVMYGAVILF